MTLTGEVNQLTTMINTLNTTVTDFMQTVIDTSDNEDQSRAVVIDALMKRTQNLYNASLQTILDNHKQEMATVMQQNTHNINTIAANITRDMASLLLARFPLNTPPGFGGSNSSNDTNGNNGMPGSSGSGGSNGILGSPIPNNLKFPTFEGTDPAGWIFQADQYFRLHHTAEGLNIDIATSYFKGEANAWYRWVQNKLTNPTWVHFCSLVRERFADKFFANPRLALSTISQQGSVRDHIREFEQLLNFVTDLPNDYIIDLFIRSFKKEIRSVFEVFEPPTLAAAFMKAIKQEDVLLSNSSFYKTVARSNPYKQASHSSGTSSDNPANAPFKKNTIPSGVKRLPLEEQRQRRKQGLCFNCDEQYKDGHICAEPLTSRLLILEMAPEFNFEGEEEITTSNTEEMVTPAAANQMHHEPTISFHALTRSPFPNTMRVTGYIAGQPLTILINSRSTHNFLHPKIAKRCGISTKSINDTMSVLVGNGGILKTQGTCSDISMKLQDYQLYTDCFLLELSGCEAVLGVAWLRTLGNISWDFKKLHMQFISNDHEHTLVGKKSASLMLLDSIPIQKVLQNTHHGFLLQLVTHSTASEDDSQVNTEVSDLLSRFSELFASPTDLPPQREHDHRIPLLPNSTPVNVRPYIDI
ncbi:uncharacterized protein LOC113350110 [Papaver somniferum]|uniref:uncharacterized protein LOC113350110 n=1 Tax=Papaver somniferum TaxID=3469 RepID=UPI000E700BD3|nr:uncharacterized protein LOC113350110 [Papaver somniferum]